MYAGTRPMCLPKADGLLDGIECCFCGSGIEWLGSSVAVSRCTPINWQTDTAGWRLEIIDRPRIKRVAQWSLSARRWRHALTDLDRQSLRLPSLPTLRLCINPSEVRNETHT